MTILKQYKIIILALVGLAIFFYVYHIWVMDKAVDYIMAEILKGIEYGRYTWFVR